jgi:hypothetical protein
MGPERLAEYRHHNRIVAGHILAGMAERIFTAGNGFG